MTITVDDVVGHYVKLRNEKEAIDADARSKTRDIVGQMEKLEAWLLDRARADGVTSFKTPHGTAFVSTTDFANIADWDVFLKFVLASQSYEMFEHRVSKRAVKSYIEAHKAVPHGVNYGTKLDIQVRKPRAKPDEEE
jgi:hypothetical protein